MKNEKFNAILASAINVHLASVNRCANQESASPGNLHRFALSRGDKYFLLTQYRDNASCIPFSLEEVNEAIEISLH